MNPTDEVENTRDVAAIVNAALAAKAHDPRRTCVSLLAIISLLVKDDVVGRIALSILMREAAAELVSGIAPEELQRLDAAKA